ncbi:aminotransferase class I/II-fold pyridoxal phosphate-dependent enzyme [Mesonia maritima]|uniref:7-keto-8-aminopelargonate synthetase-like enzyme n=1 Tax=Mesonia maritima TaxID=1793873 RepID=A0ABU1K868_9FLAO|nr:aminotransferase class I/II-fold pyridoxal phosphate-dependent enzyme [Mesonia maritima]MDR6301816.1 7-keto-8-aminopelargonate synthetase-like enzyme [Mesonia maritima]
MAQIKHNHFLDTVDRVFSHAKDCNILHLQAEGTYFDGRFIEIKGKKLYHFGTTGYLGLEQDPRLKKGAIDAIRNYGTQYPLSKSYIAHPLYQELEGLIEQLYEQPVIIAKNATLAHMAALPVLVGDRDMIILDHQVHWSVQDAAKRLKLRGVKIVLLRHNRLDLLEEKIKEWGSKAEHIWYMADGVYSMYGDFAPVKQLQNLAEKYPQLRLYFDDVHGMSWAGSKGRGYVFQEMGRVPKHSVIIGTLSKTFGANGSLIICGDPQWHEKIKNFGGSLTFSAQLDPASVGAAIASAKIHLSKEIEAMQKALQSKVHYFNRLIEEAHLPLVAHNNSPVYFLATGIPETGYTLTQALLKEGFYVNMGLFPAVPSKNTGLRITLSKHNQKEEIYALVQALKSLYPKVMKATGNSFVQLRAAFQQDFYGLKEISSTVSEDVNCQRVESIQDIAPEEWNTHMKGKGILDWNGLKFTEEAFKESTTAHEAWQFFYFRMVDAENELIVLAAFSLSRWKDDVLAPESLSKQIEEHRKKDPFWRSSPVLSLGSLFSDGLPFYCNTKHSAYKKAMRMLFQQLDTLARKHKVAQIVWRDFPFNNSWEAYFLKQGYIPIAMPEVALVEKMTWKNRNGFLQTLSSRSRKHFKKDILPYQDLVNVQVEEKVTAVRLGAFYELFTAVHQRNKGLNTFRYPIAVFKKMNSSPQWEFIVISTNNRAEEILLGVMFCYKSEQEIYVPSLIGINYTHNQTYATYRQLLFESLQQAKRLGFKKVDWGISANFEKRKLGAQLYPQKAYIKAENNFLMDELETQVG